MPLQLRNSSQGVANVYGNMVYGTSPNQININHGWKLHAGFVRDSTMQKVLDDVGIGIYYKGTASGYATPAMRVSNRQNKFDTFAKRVNDVMGVNIADFDEIQLKQFMGKFIDLRQMVDESSGATDIFRQLDFYEQANAQGLLFKGDVSRYGSGRELTFYAGQIERRDRTIKILESQFGDILQDADDIIPGMPAEKAAKNSKISQKTIGRFTTDYLPVDFEDLTKVADGGWDSDSMVDARARGTLDPGKLHMAQTGEIFPETAEELQRMAQEYPELGEALHGKTGYVSPYSTIDDLIEQSGVPQTGTPIPPAPAPAPAPAQESTPEPKPKPRQKSAPAKPSDDEISARVTGQRIGPEDIPPMPTDEDFARFAGIDEDFIESVKNMDTPELTERARERFDQEGRRRSGTPYKKEPILKVGEQTEMQGPTRKPKAKPDTTPSATVSTDPPRAMPTPQEAQDAARRAATSRATRRGIQDGSVTSAAVASGTKGSNNLRIAAAGAAIGIGAYGINKLRGMGKDDVEYARMLEMQRHYRQ
jgi:hypothetical protein